MNRSALRPADKPHCFRGNGFCLDCGKAQPAPIHNDSAPVIGHYLYVVRIPGMPDSKPWNLSDASTALEAAQALGITDAEIVWVGDTSKAAA